MASRRLIRGRITTGSAALLGLAVITALLAGTPAHAKRGGPKGEGPPPVATSIVLDAIETPSISVPDTQGAPDFYVVKNTPFDVTVTFWGEAEPEVTAELPLSYNKDIGLLLEVAAGPDEGTRLGRERVPAGATVFTFKDIRLPTAADGVKLRVMVDERRTEVAPMESAAFDVLIDSTSGSSIGGNQTDEGCQATPDEPVCADLIAPLGGFADPATLLSRGVCGDEGAARCDGTYVQALAQIHPEQEAANPATLIMKCDKSLCGGGAIKDNHLTVQLVPGGRIDQARACTSKGVATPVPPQTGTDADTFCVDYVQSKRDNAGDTHLYLLFTVDAKVRFP